MIQSSYKYRIYPAIMKLKYLLPLIFLTFGTTIANPVQLCDKTSCFLINPATLKVDLKSNSKNFPVSVAQTEEKFDIKLQNKQELVFDRNNVRVDFKLNNGSLDVSFSNIIKLKGTDNNSITFPIINNSDSFLLPMLEGRFIPTTDPKWINYLTSTTNEKNSLTGLANLSMQFLTAGFGDSVLYYQINNPFDNNFWFTGKNRLGLSFSHTFNILNEKRSFSFTIKLLKNDPNVIANTYREHKIAEDKFVTLTEKAKIAPNVTKLYGAPFIYLWGDELIGNKNVNWRKLHIFIKQQLASKTYNPTKYFNTLLKRSSNNILENFAKQKWVYPALEAQLDDAFKSLIADPKLWNKKAFASTKLNTIATSLLKEKQTSAEIIELNKNLIQSAYSKYIEPVKFWGNGVSLVMLDNLQSIGLKNAWLGLNDIQDGVYHANVVKQAVDDGYLIGPYDSYNSLQQPGKGSWSTGIFHDKSLYTKAAVIKQNGEYKTGFLGRGHSLNSSFAKPEMNLRLDGAINKDKTPFNSWFFDTDGAGDLNNDFSTEHPLSKRQDAQNRLDRMQWAANKYKLVVGTEDGKDYVAPIAVFGHGLVSQGIWDKDMRRNKNSKYYMGGYWSPDGIPDRYGKPIPLKPLLSYIYYNPSFEVPLFQLVYNDSIITSDHWEYATFKFPSEIKNNILKTFLYNYPPLLHLDRKAWSEQKPLLSKYLPVWSKWHKILVQQQMTSFSYLSKDKLLQCTKFSGDVTVIANFANTSRQYQKINVPAKSIVILEKNKIKQRFTAASF
ncbi:glycoside hydrolase [Francisella sp. Scap27]|uniref:glycoside hydrolase n=1 Tax=Francisella sp. Scap27 TaxID=2589986 RepID=UPI002118370F|nr:glycoside hydrolase [Francisella sp. Scap27]